MLVHEHIPGAGLYAEVRGVPKDWTVTLVRVGTGHVSHTFTITAWNSGEAAAKAAAECAKINSWDDDLNEVEEVREQV